MAGNERNIKVKIDHVEKIYEGRKGRMVALNGIDLDIMQDVSVTMKSGEFVSLVGPSGCGKSTLLNIIAGLLPATSGAVYVDGKKVEGTGTERGVVFQQYALFPWLTVLKNVMFGLKLKGMNDAQAREIAMKYIRMVELEEFVDAYPKELSGGMKQRVVIAIALACHPDVLIADEPTTALDVTIQAQVLEMMKELKKQYGTSMIMITHDLGIVADICDEVSVVYAGRVVEHGTLEDIFDHTLHPYTEGLFNSLPNMADRTQRLKPIKGLMPDPSNLPEGCAFCPRCNYAKDICARKKPGRLWSNDTHYVECHLYNENNIRNGEVLKGE